MPKSWDTWRRQVHAGCSLSNIQEQDLKSLFSKQTSLIDVRAPIEFTQGTLPGAVNIPIMDDAQRAAVGTTYKEMGRDEALKLGHHLVSGKIKEDRVNAWKAHIRENPDTVLFCFRGGLRSKITQQWLKENGVERPLIEGGYKFVRQFLREIIDRESEKPFLILSGPTGSAKTRVLRKAAEFYPTLDLESLACHRGSAFGATGDPQPTQINFENSIAQRFLQLDSHQGNSPILVEDESRLIGRCAIPESLFAGMRASALVFLEAPFAERVENIFQDYVVNTAIGLQDRDAAQRQYLKFKNSIKMISRKLGGARTTELLNDLEACEQEYLKGSSSLDSNRVWIEKLLNYYYDPSYAQSFAKRNPQVLFRGNHPSVLDFLTR